MLAARALATVSDDAERRPLMTAAAELRPPRAPAAAALSRRWLEAQLRDGVPDEAVNGLKTVVSELVNNAVVHGAGAITVRLERLSDAVRIEVVDEGTGSVPAIREAADAGGGWGLRLVDELSRRWGVFEGSAHVWAEVPL
jgi:anti-sigma regulatory factor (Ser/Thr protein kinase)